MNGTVALVSDEMIKGSLKVIHIILNHNILISNIFYYKCLYSILIKVGATVEVKCSDKKEFVEATIQKIQDCSQYTVGMNDL